MSEADARQKMAQEGWTMVEDAGRGWRRVVASPRPVQILELAAIQALLNQGAVVIAVGGGGIPVMETGSGDLTGVEAVIDKDYASALLASALPAELFVISTAVEKVALNYNKPEQRWLDRLTLAEAKQFLAEGHFHQGSMGPKIEAMVSYLELGGRQGLITNPENIGRALAGDTGTWLVP
jgi:carbamate kinase